jgi:FtsZ-binding cell division protein ZapB
LDDLTKLEEKIDQLISIISELRQEAEDLTEQNSQLKSRDRVIKEKVESLIQRINNLLI